MSTRPFIIHLIGPSASGKSSTFNAIGEKLQDEIYNLSYDKIKWQLTHYDRDKHRYLIKDLVVDFFGLICKRKIPIFLDIYIKDEEEYASLKQIAAVNGYTFLSVELTAPIEVLLERFRARVQDAKIVGNKIGVTSEEIFLSQTSRRPYVPENVPVFDTSKEKTEVIAEKIIELLNKTSDK